MPKSPLTSYTDRDITVILERVEPTKGRQYVRLGTVAGARILKSTAGNITCHKCMSDECEHVQAWTDMFGF